MCLLTTLNTKSSIQYLIYKVPSTVSVLPVPVVRIFCYLIGGSIQREEYLSNQQLLSFTTTTTSYTHPLSRQVTVRSLLNYHPYKLQNMVTTTTVSTATTSISQSPVNHDTALSSSMTTTTSTTTNTIDIEELHNQACQLGQMSYIDPSTGFICFTKLAHIQRGVCCGNYCRHCPYEWKNTPKNKNNNNDSNDDDSNSSCSSSDASDQSDIAENSPLHMNGEIGTNETTQPDARTVTIKTKTGGKHGGTYTNKNVVYTRGGDKGTSQLLNGERRMKSDIVFEALGTVDELCSVVGVCYAELDVTIQTTMEISTTGTTTNVSQKKEDLQQLQVWLLEIMSRLFDIGSHVAKPRKINTDNNNNENTNNFTADGIGNGFDSNHIIELEKWIDIMTDALPELTSFVLPTGSRTSAQLHIARTVCRRTERTIVPLIVTHPHDNNNVHGDNTNTPPLRCDPNTLAYINRLSDFFFTAARYVNNRLGVSDIAYQRPTRTSKQRTRVTLNPSDEQRN